ncbi:hypothetical protein [Microbulbifer rhizosphaerae]|uniref:Uncharacterized protein n=1 Tax=Microbulbifer rhizosphaerae TaxID=1562603 RepID=A0A7W4Z962_9GAMM|nr:hypothetical protein [Microbulbifer rhizosphaerae]MBB3059890.1 hypothetical protein [Microbulbifer rhizosphaerae]
MKLKFLLSLFLTMPLIANAGIHCAEDINAAILHQNGNIYFMSSQTCKNWCQIKWSSEEDKNRAYSTLLTARTADREITFYWSSLSSCSDSNPTYASPEYMAY